MENDGTLFRIVPTDGGKFLVTERQLGSRHVAFVARCESRTEAIEWIHAATDSAYDETGLIFPSLRDDVRYRCVQCGTPCRLLLCANCHELATSSGFVDDAPIVPPTPYVGLPEVGLPVSVDGISRFG